MKVLGFFLMGKTHKLKNKKPSFFPSKKALKKMGKTNGFFG